MQCALNYVWISDRNYYDPSQFASRSPIPAEYLNNALCIAGQNPDVTTLIWYDPSLVTKAETQVLEDLPLKPANVKFMDLRDVSAYRNLPLFALPNETPNPTQNPHAVIWKKVDLARMLVLDHVFRRMKAKEAIYSDFDIIQPEVRAPELKTLLNKFGVFFSKFDRDGQVDRPFVENGFMGFKHTRAPAIRRMFIRKTLEEYADGSVMNGWLAFRSCAVELSNAIQQDVNTTSVLIRSFWGGEKPHFSPYQLVLGQKPTPQNMGAARLRQIITEGRQRYGAQALV